MRAAEIVDGKVFNIIEVESLDFKPNLVETRSANIGDLYADGVFSTPPEDPEKAKAAALAEIDQLERDSLMNRGVRETMLRLYEDRAPAIAAERGVTVEQVLASVPAYVKFKALDDQIAELRSKL